MPKNKTKSVNENSVTTNQDSTHLAHVEDEGGLNYNTGTLYQNAFHGLDSYEHYTSPHCRHSSYNSSGSEQDGSELGFDKRGVGLDFAILDSTFLLSQVVPTLFMGTVVQFAQSVTAYITFSAIFGAIAICLTTQIIFDQSDLER